MFQTTSQNIYIYNYLTNYHLFMFNTYESNNTENIGFDQKKLKKTKNKTRANKKNKLEKTKTKEKTRKKPRKNKKKKKKHQNLHFPQFCFFFDCFFFVFFSVSSCRFVFFGDSVFVSVFVFFLFFYFFAKIHFLCSTRGHNSIRTHDLPTLTSLGWWINSWFKVPPPERHSADPDISH